MGENIPQPLPSPSQGTFFPCPPHDHCHFHPATICLGAGAGLDDLVPFPPCTAVSLLSLTLSLSLRPAGDHSLSIMLVQPVAWEGPWGGDVVWGPPDRGGRGGAGVRRTAEPFTDSLGAAVRGASRTQREASGVPFLRQDEA